MPKSSYTLEDFNFELPGELIAQHPADRRDSSRLFVLNRNTGKYTHAVFSGLPGFIREGDVLVFNNARVIPARIMFKRDTGGVVEVILNRRLSSLTWIVLTNRTKRLKQGEVLRAARDPEISITLLERVDDFYEVRSSVELDDETLAGIGEIPLPPYIRRSADEEDLDRYQTVYGTETGAVAAPTAGLHFTGELMQEIRERGAETVFLTMHVGWGTFQPVRENDISGHRMHTEHYLLPGGTADAVNRAREKGGRVIAVGTTSLRVLESTFINGRNEAGEGDTDIFIYPPFRVKSIDAIITNFHTPRSTLLMLVSAFAGYDRIMDAYSTAVEMQYRFFSYGDAMLIE